MLLKIGRKSIELVLSIANAAVSLNYFLKSIIIVALITCKDFPPAGIETRSSKCWHVSPKASMDRSAAAVSLALGGI